MNKTELIAKVAETCGMTKKDADKAVTAVFETISSELQAGGKVQLIGFGTFETRERKARPGRNPRTGEVTQIAASKSAAFKPGKVLKDSLNA